MASRSARPPASGSGHCDAASLQEQVKICREDRKLRRQQVDEKPFRRTVRLKAQVEFIKEAPANADEKFRQADKSILRASNRTNFDLSIPDEQPPSRPVQARCLLVIVIAVPILMNSMVAISSAHRLASGPLESAAAPETYLMRAGSESDEQQNGFIGARELGFGAGLASSMDELEAQKALVPANQLDWAQRLSRAPSLLHQPETIDSQWPSQQDMASEFLGQNYTSPGQNFLGQAIEQQPQQQQQQSPLSRVIEATKMFVKQQHQQIAAAANTAAALTTNYQPLPSLQLAAESGGLNNEPLGNFQPQANSSQVANRLYNFLFQPKGQLLSSALSQSLAEVRRKMSQQHADSLPSPPPLVGQEPFQLASSEGNFQHAPNGRAPSRPAREHRSLVTLSAPYEQQQPEGAAAAISHPNMLPLASGRQVARAIESTHEQTPQHHWQTGHGEVSGLEDQADDQQQREAEQSGELAGQVPGQGEAEQRHLALDQNSTHWTVGNYAQQDEPDEQIEPQRQQQQPPLDHHAEVLEQAGEGEEQAQQQQVVMINGGEIYEQQQPMSEQNNELMLQRLNSSSTSSAAYLLPAGHDESSNETSAAIQPEEQHSEDEANSEQGDESLPTVHLPSQYESAIGIPPEGHYDDYFKPVGAASLLSAVTSSTSNETSGNSSRVDQQSDLNYQYYMNQQHPEESLKLGGPQTNFTSPQPESQTFTGQKVIVLRPVESTNGSHYQTMEGNNFAATNRSVGENQHETSQPKARYQIVINHGDHQQAVNASGVGNEEGVQLIVANSQDQLQDPNSNEKVITYTSENGQDSFARLVGKPARQTFFNKDLNESPTASPGPGVARPQVGRPTTNPSRRPTRSPVATSSTPTAPARPISTTASAAGELTEDAYEMLLEPSQEVGSEQGQFGRYATQTTLANRDDRQQFAPIGPKKKATQRGREQVAAPRAHQPHHHQHQPDRSHSARHSNNNQQQQLQQTVRRPQVTEAKFQLKDLPLNAPTPSPALDATTAAKSIVELPAKAKRLRDNQADKNELMSELLAALDRVKAAIYKLQPLTAKMNAIYRKSVTSNTRDQILDNHKGTYAKRYPPGDYDDSYDRMHPSELIERQRGAYSSRSSGANATRAAKVAAIERRADGRGQFRTILVDGDESDEGQQAAEQFQASGSKTNAVYLPAPRELFDQMRNRSQLGPAARVRLVEGDHVESREIGRAGEVMKRAGEIVYDDENEGPQEGGSWAKQLSRRAGNLLPAGSTRDEESPLFGYRITIYQSPSEGDESDSDAGREMAQEAREKEILSYSLIDDGQGQPIEFSSVNQSGRQTMNWPTFDLRPSVGIGDRGPDSQVDSMATSESSLVPLVDEDEAGDQDEDSAGDHVGDRDGAESGEVHEFSEDHKKRVEKKKDQKMEEAKGQRKKKKAKGKKEGEKRSKKQHKGKKGQEEHKKKKEFKKIKHHKGLMSKESHKLHRDKHIKAHDRGAAKEKALKERTQIEFFEREQIVDDEFEKGKKSTIKAGWATGHDSKKSSSEIGGKPEHDSMSMGSSDQLGRLADPTGNSQPAAAASSLAPMMMDSAASNEHQHHHTGHGKGKSHSTVSSSGKQWNKFEKKHMEAKGKKFKGWREKGYKIITETEFIDRGKSSPILFRPNQQPDFLTKLTLALPFNAPEPGSLHDSAYKKRDKGAAHHQKFKKHESKSEGHQGSMHELHKKSHKKEEKESKSEERKKEMTGKEEAGGKEVKKSSKKKGKESKEMAGHKKKAKHSEDHSQEESTLSLTASRVYSQLPALNQTQGHNDHLVHFGVTRQHRPAPAGTENPVASGAEVNPGAKHQVGAGPSPANQTPAMASTMRRSENNATDIRLSRLAVQLAAAAIRQQEPTGDQLRTTLARLKQTNGSRPNSAGSNSTSSGKELELKQAKPQMAAGSGGQLPKLALSENSPTFATVTNATLIDIINRLNVSRVDRDAPELRLSNATAGDRRHEQLSPLVRLVNSLARMNQTQTRLAGSEAPRQNPRRQQQAGPGKVQFDEQTAVRSAASSSSRQKLTFENGNNLQDYGNNNRQPLPKVMVKPIEQAQYDLSIVQNRRWPLDPIRTLPAVQQQQQQYFLQEDAPFEQHHQQRAEQKLLFDAPPPPPPPLPDSGLSFMDQFNYMADYDPQLPRTSAADYQQHQPIGPLLVPQTSFPQMQQRLQQVSFLTD